MCGAIPPLPNTPPLRGAQLKYRDSFIFTFKVHYRVHMNPSLVPILSHFPILFPQDLY